MAEGSLAVYKYVTIMHPILFFFSLKIENKRNLLTLMLCLITTKLKGNARQKKAERKSRK